MDYTVAKVALKLQIADAEDRIWLLLWDYLTALKDAVFANYHKKTAYSYPAFDFDSK